MGVEATNNKKRIFFKNLDAWRFVAFFGVFLYHSFNTTQDSILGNSWFKRILDITGHGRLGVDLFFVLSGFLITYLLLVEESKSKNNLYNILSFWGRRVLRIWPLYFMIVFYAFVLYEPLIELITKNAREETASIFYYLFFIPNFQLIYNDPYPLNNCLTVLWSVGVEEQFYLFWPLLFFIKRIRGFVIGTLILGSIYFRYLNIEDFKVIHYHTISAIGILGIGCLLGYLSFKYRLSQASISIPRIINLLIYLIGIATIFYYPSLFKSEVSRSLYASFCGLFFAYVIFEQIFVKRPLFHLGKIKFFDTWGRYTYGLYCLHPIGILIAFNITKKIGLEESIYWVCIGETTLSFILSLLLAWVSYHAVEKHFLKLKKKISTVSSHPKN